MCHKYTVPRYCHYSLLLHHNRLRHISLQKFSTLKRHSEVIIDYFKNKGLRSNLDMFNTFHPTNVYSYILPFSCFTRP